MMIIPSIFGSVRVIIGGPGEIGRISRDDVGAVINRKVYSDCKAGLEYA